jgi:cytochrome P450
MAVPDDLLAPDAVADPHAFFRCLREHAPVHWSERHKAWIVTSHAELGAALRDPRLSTARMDAFESRLSATRREALAPAIELLRGWMLFHDPPAHTRLRAPVARAFTPRRVEKLRAKIEAVTAELLDELARAGGADLVEAFAHPLPAIVIAELFGVPRADREKIRRWSAKFGVVVFGATERADYERVASEAGLEFRDYIRWLIAERKREGAARDDLLGALLAGCDEPGGLREAEISGACSLLLFAGHDTTASLIGSGTLALLRDPEQRAALPDEPEAAATAVEELLRFEGPAKIMMRRALVTHERAGQTVAAGDAVFLAIPAANRDPAIFARPDALDLTRTPNPHLAFGDGIHFCLGAPLARLEARIALTRLFARFPRLALASEQVTWRPTISDRSLVSLPITI